MKRLLVILLALCVLVGLSGNVSADQGVTVTIDENNAVIITPTTLEFGAVQQGTNENPSTTPITFTADTGANMDMTVEFTAVTTNGLFELMELNIQDSWVGITTQPEVELPCVISGSVCTYTPVDVNARLDIPSGYPAGTKTGTITYTITGTIPN